MDTRRRPRRLFGLLAPEAPDDTSAFRDWHDFESLIGHEGSALLRGPFGRIRRLKPAQIADLLEEASKEEETEILGQVHADPELEADVFEEIVLVRELARAGWIEREDLGRMRRIGAQAAHDALAAAGERVTLYHAGLSGRARHDAMTAFLDGPARIIAATVAFGMGIDKPDVRWVLHFDPPPSPDAMISVIDFPL